MNKTATILELRTFVQPSTGNQIIEALPIDGDMPDDTHRFSAALTLTGKLSDGREFKAQRPFSIIAENIEEAFERMPQAMSECRAVMEHEIASKSTPQLVIPEARFKPDFNGRFRA